MAISVTATLQSQYGIAFQIKTGVLHWPASQGTVRNAAAQGLR